MQKRHQDRRLYFEEQAITTKKYVIPYIENHLHIDENTKVLEIGCGEGGNLKPFLEMGCPCVGIDLNQKQIENARTYFKDLNLDQNLDLIYQDIYDTNPETLGAFDVIIMRDVIEHIHNQEKFMGFVKQFLKPKGKFFLGFPPWYMPFGGHQQICRSKFLSKLPYFHLLPYFLYKKILKFFGEGDNIIKELLNIKETGISIERFNSVLKQHNYHINQRDYYFINPNYEVKFGLTPRKTLSIIAAIPFLRNFVTTCCYYVISECS